MVPHGGLVLCKLVSPWRGSNRLVGNAYFASESTAEKLLELGFSFISVVKQCARKFPMKYLSEQELLIKVVFHSTIKKNDSDQFDSVALVWLYKNRRYFIAKTGDTTTGESTERVCLSADEISAKYWQNITII